MTSRSLEESGHQEHQEPGLTVFSHHNSDFKSDENAESDGDSVDTVMSFSVPEMLKAGKYNSNHVDRPNHLTAATLDRSNEAAPQATTSLVSSSDPDNLNTASGNALLAVHSEAAPQAPRLSVGTAMYTATSHPSYGWKDNSCWLDTSMEVFFNALMRPGLYFHFAACFSGVNEGTLLHAFFQVMDRRRMVYMENGRTHTVAWLAQLRDQFRQSLHDS